MPNDHFIVKQSSVRTMKTTVLLLATPTATLLATINGATAFTLGGPTTANRGVISINRRAQKQIIYSSQSAAETERKESVIPSGADFEAYLGSYSSCTSEIAPTVLTCPLPADFPVGTYYRNGGCRFEADDGTKVMHPFDADGMICAATFDPENQRMLFRNKFVETEGYLQDKATGTMTKRGVFGTMRSGGMLANIFRMDFKNVANTNVLHVGDKLYALWEGGRPYVLDPLTLRNMAGPGAAGETDLDGLLSDEKSTMSAHPRYDTARDVWVTFGYNFDPSTGGTIVDLFELDNKGFRSTRRGRIRFVKEGPALIHDFVLTENYMLFNLNKAAVSPQAGLKAILGMGAFAECIALDESATETQLVLIPRSIFDEIEDGKEIEIDVLNDNRVKVVDAPFHANFHFSNGFEDEDGQVVFDTVQSIQRDLLRPPSNADEPVIANDALWRWLFPSTITRYAIDPENECLAIGVPPKILATRPAEFPSVPKDLSTRRHRYVYAGGSHNEIVGSTPQTRGSGPQTGSIMKIDTEDPTQNELYSFKPYEFVGESVFVPKIGRDVTKPEEEDAGYLVSYLTNGRDKTTDLVIFSVEGKGALERGPVVRVTLPTFIPQGLHGCFAKDVTFDFGQFENN